jgi:hypothetical protein
MEKPGSTQRRKAAQSRKGNMITASDSKYANKNRFLTLRQDFGGKPQIRNEGVMEFWIGGVEGGKIGAAGLTAPLSKCHNSRTDPFTFTEIRSSADHFGDFNEMVGGRVAAIGAWGCGDVGTSRPHPDWGGDSLSPGKFSGVRPSPGAATLARASGWEMLWRAGYLPLLRPRTGAPRRNTKKK